MPGMWKWILAALFVVAIFMTYPWLLIPAGAGIAVWVAIAVTKAKRAKVNQLTAAEFAAPREPKLAFDFGGALEASADEPIRTKVQPPRPQASAPKPRADRVRFDHGRLVDAWSTYGAHPRAVVGESFHKESFKALRGRVQTLGVAVHGGIEVNDEAVVATQPDNPFDANAVAIYIDGYLVGHLPREIAADYAPVLAGIEADGKRLRAPARLWVSSDFRSGPIGSVTVTLPPPTGLMPYNDLPNDAHVVLPVGSPLKVKLDASTGWLVDSFSLTRGERCVAVVLTSDDGGIAVALDGVIVGALRPSSSEKVLGLVEYVASRGYAPVAQATLAGSELGASLAIQVARTPEVPQAWLNRVAALTSS